MSRYPFNDFDRIKWSNCHGTFSNGNDCLTPKGFTFLRARLDHGVYVDVYNVHADADSDAADMDARAKNIKQVADFINSVSVMYFPLCYILSFSMEADFKYFYLLLLFIFFKLIRPATPSFSLETPTPATPATTVSVNSAPWQA
jgi:hypothetical protein